MNINVFYVADSSFVHQGVPHSFFGRRIVYNRGREQELGKKSKNINNHLFISKRIKR